MEPMRFFFDERKAVQAAALLLDCEGGRMRYIKLIKLLYLADRTALIETGLPITGDRFVSMRYGPVLSHVLDLIRSRAAGSRFWDPSIRTQGYEVSLTRDPGRDELSEYDVETLRRIFEVHGRNTAWMDVVNATHGLPEWTDPGASSHPIEPAEILRYAGFEEDAVRACVAQANAIHALRSGLAQAG